MSTRRTRLPLRPNPAASETEVEVLPVPPFCEAIETIIFRLTYPKPKWGICISYSTFTLANSEQIVNRLAHIFVLVFETSSLETLLTQITSCLYI